MDEAAEENGQGIWERVRSELEYWRKPYPYAAMEVAREHRAVVTPHLIATLERLAADPEPARHGDYMLHFYALCLLAEFREKRAYRPMLALASQPEDVAEDLFGDFIGDSLGRAIASVCDGDIALLEALAEDKSCDVWVRGAALDALSVLALEGDQPLDDTIARLTRIGEREASRQLASPESGQDDIFLSIVVNSLCDLGVGAAMPTVREWFNEKLIDELFVDLAWVKVEAARDIEALRTRAHERRRGYVRDAVKEMDWWASFKEDDESEKEKSEDGEFEDDELDFESPLPYVRETPKIGRNAPCPCGSGKKFKKCCGLFA